MTAQVQEAVGRTPDFLVIGAQKSGTSSIANALREAPGFFISARKELHYFQHFDPTADTASWSRYQREFAGAPAGVLAGEATPNYLPKRVVPARIRSVAPNVRLIASLRNPVDRAYSAYWHAIRFGVVKKSLTFAQFIEREARDFGDGWTTAVGDGCYSTQLQCYYQHFDREQLLVVLFDDLIRDPGSTMTRVIRHINPASDVEFTWKFPHSNPAHLRFAPRLARRILNPRGKPARPLPGLRRMLMRERQAMPPIEPHVRAMLTDLYRPWNRELESMIERPLAGWGT